MRPPPLLLHSEPGADIVAKHIDDALLSAVNYSEVLKKTIERGGVLKPISELIRSLAIDIVPFDASRPPPAPNCIRKASRTGCPSRTGPVCH